MQSRNPAFSRSPAFSDRGGYATFQQPAPHPTDLQSMYDAPSATAAQTGRMTYDDVVAKTGIAFGVLLLGAALAWFISPALAIPGLIVGLILGLVIAFKQSTNPALILSYAAAEGMFVGGISAMFESSPRYEGIVAQAVIGTLLAVAAMLAVYKSGRLRATPKFTKIVIGAGMAYLGVALVSFVAGAFFNVGDGWGFRTGGLGILLGLAGATIACLFLVLDFDFVEKGVKNGLPERYGWLAAFGLMATVVWLYIEILRLLAILRGND
jgi:uncharacterized YccA/Bax inhibitor family protein